MEPHVPDVELFIVFKWMIVLLIGAGVAQLSALAVKRWWYGEDKHSRREDDADSRGWMERFLQNQKDHTAAEIQLATEMHQIMLALQDNGRIIKDFVERSECKYETHGGRR